MKMAKKLLAMVLASAMALCVLTGCGGGGGGSSAVSTKALVDELNKTGTVKFEASSQPTTTEDVTVMREHANVHLAQGYPLDKAVLYSVEDQMRAILKQEPQYTEVSLTFAIITNSSNLSAQQLAEQTKANVRKSTVKRDGTIIRTDKSYGFDLTEGATYTVNSVTFSTNAGTCTVVVLGEKG